MKLLPPTTQRVRATSRPRSGDSALHPAAAGSLGLRTAPSRGLLGNGAPPIRPGRTTGRAGLSGRGGRSQSHPLFSPRQRNALSASRESRRNLNSKNDGDSPNNIEKTNSEWAEPGTSYTQDSNPDHFPPRNQLKSPYLHSRETVELYNQLSGIGDQLRIVRFAMDKLKEAYLKPGAKKVLDKLGANKVLENGVAEEHQLGLQYDDLMRDFNTAKALDATRVRLTRSFDEF